MQLRKFIIILLIVLPVGVLGQEKDITGLWKGTLFNDTTQKYYKYELGISKEKGKYTGFSHTWFLIGDTQYFGVKKVAIRIASDGKILVEDNGLIANNYPIPPNKGVKQLNVLTLDASDSLMTLTGPFSTNRTKDYHSLTGSISIQRKNDYWQSSLVPHLQELGRDEELSFVKAEKQSLAAVDAAERDLQIAQRKALTIEQKSQAEKQRQEELIVRKAATEKEKQAVAIKKEEDKQIVRDEKALAKAEITHRQESERNAAEKEKISKQISKQEKDKQTAAEREAQKELAAKEKNERIAAVEKDKQVKAIARQEALQEAANEKALTEQQKTKSALANTENLPGKPSFKTNSDPAADVASRKTVIQQTVNFSSDSLQLSLYDNGEIDGDTVSVLMNGELILAKQGLGIKAIKHTIFIPRNVDKIEMVMYAETLGNIPPNTGLLVIKDGKDLYEIRFSGDLQKNASIVFNRRKE